jgi:hypothetical protein
MIIYNHDTLHDHSCLPLQVMSNVSFVGVADAEYLLRYYSPSRFSSWSRVHIPVDHLLVDYTHIELIHILRNPILVDY